MSNRNRENIRRRKQNSQTVDFGKFIFKHVQFVNTVAQAYCSRPIIGMVLKIVRGQRLPKHKIRMAFFGQPFGPLRCLRLPRAMRHLHQQPSEHGMPGWQKTPGRLRTFTIPVVAEIFWNYFESRDRQWSAYISTVYLVWENKNVGKNRIKWNCAGAERRFRLKRNTVCALY